MAAIDSAGRCRFNRRKPPASVGTFTLMFCDLVDSTGIASKLDAEEWRDLVGISTPRNLALRTRFARSADSMGFSAASTKAQLIVS
jgi:hypothetical protein